MTVGDYGVALPVTFDGITIGTQDMFKFTFKKHRNGEALLVKDVAAVQSVVSLVLSASDSALFPVGEYVYSLDWYQNGAFLCNAIPIAAFKVVGKA